MSQFSQNSPDRNNFSSDALLARCALCDMHICLLTRRARLLNHFFLYNFFILDAKSIMFTLMHLSTLGLLALANASPFEKTSMFVQHPNFLMVLIPRAHSQLRYGDDGSIQCD